MVDMTHVPEGTPEWFAARAGIITCSRLPDLLATSKRGEPLKAYDDLLQEKTWEVLAGKPAERNVGFAALRGSDLEAVALQQYANRTGRIVSKPGLVMHPRIERFGGTPDGLTAEGYCLEVKCPASQAKVMRLRIYGDIEKEYYDQIQGQLAVTQLQIAHLVIFDDRLPPEYQLTVIDVPRDNERIEWIEHCVWEFLKKLDENVARARGERL